MNNIDLNNLDNDSLKNLLKDLKSYRSAIKKLWKRWTKVFSNLMNKKDSYVVEYAFWISKDDILNKVLEVYLKCFWVKPYENDLVFIENKNLIWWIKVFLNDNMVDLSFSKIKKSFR